MLALFTILLLAHAHGPLSDAEALLNAGDFDAAEEVADHTFKTSGRRKRVDAAGLLARIWLARDEPLEAARVLAPVADNPRAALDVIEVQAALRTASEMGRDAMDTAAVFALCEAVQLLGPLPPRMQYDRGWAHLLDGDITPAVRDFEASFTTLSAAERPFVASLVSEVRRDGSPEVALQFATAGVVDPGVFETDLHLLRGLAAWRAGELDIAYEELSSLHTERPNAVHAAWLGQIEVARNRHDEAIARFEQCIRLAPREPMGWIGLSLALQSKGDPELLYEARGALRRAAQLAPYDPSILASLIDILRATGEDAQADPLQERLERLALP